MPEADYQISGGGSVFIITPLNAMAKENLESGLSDEAQWFGGGVAVEHSYIAGLIEQLREDGWSIR